jgi:lipopolysaccharide export system protein LptC
LSILSQTQDRGALGYMPASRSDRRRAFRAARRHSAFVRLLRVGLPVAAVLGVIAMIGMASVLDPLRALAKLPINISGLVVSGTKITMQQPRFAGFTQDARPYLVTAEKAAQDVTNPDRIELDQIRATMDLKDSGAFELLAQSGIFENKTDTLTLLHRIVINSPAYQASLSEAVINVRSGHVLSEKPVEVTMLQGTLIANRLEVLNSGEIIRFDNGVTMELTPAAGAGNYADAGSR